MSLLFNYLGNPFLPAETSGQNRKDNLGHIVCTVGELDIKQEALTLALSVPRATGAVQAISPNTYAARNWWEFHCPVPPSHLDCNYTRKGTEQVQRDFYSARRRTSRSRPRSLSYRDWHRLQKKKTRTKKKKRTTWFTLLISEIRTFLLTETSDQTRTDNLNCVCAIGYRAQDYSGGTYLRFIDSIDGWSSRGDHSEQTNHKSEYPETD